MDVDFQEYIDKAKSVNTKYSETSAYNALKRFMLSLNIDTEPNNLPPAELSKLLCNFFIHGKKKDGTNFEPDSLSTISREYSVTLFLNDMVMIFCTMNNFQSVNV